MDSEALRKRQELFEKVREQIDLSKSIIIHSKQIIEKAKQQEERLRKEYNVSLMPLKGSTTKGLSNG